ncbi:zinc finger domain-containing stress-associated protein [Paramecium bursaria Chlorella virus KS1B]|nr:zinc finger domain-containing stress-associated protein [Paramecium bursaria Chlorella virus KS1B]
MTLSIIHQMSRCEICRKKTGLLGFVCKCGHTFCEKHRLMESHSCPTLQSKEIIILEKVVADKLANRM